MRVWRMRRWREVGVECMQARNSADQLVYSAEKNIEDFKDKVTTEIVDAIKAAIAECVPPHAWPTCQK